MLAIVVCVSVSLSPIRQGFADAPARGPGDIDLYRAEVQRIRAGEGYYQAASAELLARGYPTRSVFNWRTPLPMWLLGRLPHDLLGKALLCLLALGAIVTSFQWLEREGSTWQAYGAALAMVGALLPCALDNLGVMPVLWSGTLIVLSLAANGLGRTKSAIAWGTLAMVFRDLAGLYCLAMLGLAVWHRRWREALGWMLGIACYLAFFAWHAAQVSTVLTATAHAHRESWFQSGGLPFVLAVAQMNSFLLVLPQWVTAIVLPLAILGLAGWQTAAGQRLGCVVCCYLAAFAFIGHPFNQYWGALLAPLLAIGLSQTPASLRNLLQVAQGKSAVSAPTVATGH